LGFVTQFAETKDFERDGKSMSINKNQVIQMLLKTIPGFETAWQEHLKYWGAEERGEYNDIAEIARYIVESYANDNVSEFPTFFETVEAIVNEGDNSAKELAIIGVLEDIQTISSHESFGPKVFLEWLGESSTDAWNEIGKLWEAGGGSLAGVLRFESASKSKKEVT
jgi:hypothetical protein